MEKELHRLLKLLELLAWKLPPKKLLLVNKIAQVCAFISCSCFNCIIGCLHLHLKIKNKIKIHS